MIDKITLDRIELLHPKIKEEAKALYQEISESLSNGVICRFSHTFRSIEEQNALYSKGRSIKGQVVTNAKGGQSFHNFGLAVDIVLIVEGKATWERGQDFDHDGQADFMEVVKIFKKYGWFWGGDFRTFKDYPHFEKTFGFTTKQLLSKEKIGLYPKI
jgi:peptidoglycan L-alanyl-D-glutamate endopeptidase CwlK